jgi:hypothetical protein
MMSDRDSMHSMAEAKLVARDNERFKLLFTNSRPHIPGGKLAPVGAKLTRSLIGERMRALKASLSPQAQ